MTADVPAPAGAIVRVFETAVQPDDVERAVALFRDKIVPAFARFEGCHGIDLHLGLDEHSADLVTLLALSRWDSMDSIQRALDTPEYEDSLRDLRLLFKQTPLVRHFEPVG